VGTVGDGDEVMRGRSGMGMGLGMDSKFAGMDGEWGWGQKFVLVQISTTQTTE